MSDKQIRMALGSVAEILENTKAVKGEKFSTFVGNAINMRSLLSMVHMLADAAPEGFRAKEELGRMAVKAVSQITCALSDALGMSDADVKEALAVADLASNAFESAGGAA